MAVYKIFPQQDATIYSEYVDVNTGRDEILEISSYYKGTATYANRALLQFNMTEVNDVLTNYVQTDTGGLTQFSASLRLFLASANEVPTSYTVYAHPVYVPETPTTWVAGNGKYGDLPRNSSGVSWQYTQASGSGLWTADNPAPPYYVTRSFSSGSATGGGTWFTTTGTVNFDMYQTHGVDSTHDLNIDVTDGVLAHVSGAANGGIDNAGFIVKLKDSEEFQTNYQMYLRYFSSNTHTIYPPCLEIKWDDYTAGTGLSEVSDTNCVVKIKNNRGEYTDEGRQKFELHVRPKYPTRTFATSSVYLTNNYLPTSTYWGLKDENTEEMVIDFDTVYTKVSRSSTGNYFYVHMGGLEPERYYRVLLKTTIDGSTTILDENLVFKVVRNG